MKRARLQTRIDATLKAELRALATSRGLAMNDLIEEALHEYLNPDDYKTVSLEYLSRLEKRHALALKRLDIALETLGKFVLVWFMNTPEVPDEKLKIAMARGGMARYEIFLDKVSKSLKSNSVRHAFETRRLKEDDFDHGGRA